MTFDPEKQPLTSGSNAPDILSLATNPAASRRRPLSIFSLIAIRAILILVLLGLLNTETFRDGFGKWTGYELRRSAGHAADHPSRCEQFEGKAPAADGELDGNKDVIFSPEYREESSRILSGLVQVRSESFDDNGEVGKDPRWEVFFDLEKYLLKTFPLLHETLDLTKVNTHGLVYTWAGSDESLKPAMLMAHQDTVPVPSSTLDYWTYPPWSGHYDGRYLWGRGASDCKNTLSGTLEAVTLLLEKGFKPRRTLILAFGFDEESKGWEGAGEISKHLDGLYGQDGLAFIVDEGGLGIGEMYGAAFALPATGEKGYLDVNFTLHTPGGHSSVPPEHTGIGMLSSLVTSLESSPYSPSLSLESPIFSLLTCAAEYGNLSEPLKKGILAGGLQGKVGDVARQIVADTFAGFGRAQRYLVSTSQAVDIIGGGVKVNALPETAFVVVNYRVSVVKERITEKAHELAKEFSLDVDAFGEKFSYGSTGPEGVSGGELKVVGINELQPAPISPTSSSAWKLLSSTIQHAYADQFEDGLIVAPCVMTGNTDTRFHWNLSKHIYRFTPMDREGSIGIHTVDEHLLFDDHISGIWFYHELIRNADAADL